MQTILIIGGAGFIGASLVRKYLGDKGWRVVVLEPETADLSRLEPFAGRIELVRGTLDDTALIADVIDRYGVVVAAHLVSTMIPGSSLEHFRKETDRIISPSASLFRLCAEKKVKLVFFSSGGTVYGNNGGRPHREDDIRKPISYYGLSKSIIEDLVYFEHRRSGLDYLIVRPSNAYGPGQKPGGKQGLIAVAAGKALRGEALQIWGDGKAVRDYIYVDDLTDAVFRLIEKGVSCETVNVGSGKGYQVNEVLSILGAHLDRPLKVEYVDKRTVDVDSIVLDCSKISSLIDFHPTSLEEGIQLFTDSIGKI